LNQGSAYVFVRSGTAWSLQSKLIASDGHRDDNLGSNSVAIDGDFVVVGASGANSWQGTAYTFVRERSTWIEKNQLQASDGANSDRFGSRVAMEGDRILVSAPDKPVGGNAAQGVGYFFIRSVGSPDLASEDDSGISNSDNITNHRSLSFTISDITPGATVEFLRESTVLVSVMAATDTVTVTDPFAPDNVSIRYSTRQTINGETTSPSILFVTVDTLGPTPTVMQSPGQADPTRVQPISFISTFSEPVYGSLTPTAISLAGSSANVSSAIISASLQNGIATIGVSNILSEGTIVVSLVADALVDAAGNPNVHSVAGDNVVTYDTTGPSVTVNQAASQPDPWSSPVNFTVVFSEPLGEELHPSDVSFAGSTINPSFLRATVSGSGTTYNVAVEIFTQTTGTLVLSIPAAVISDLAGNLNSSSTSVDNVVTIDTVLPTVTINQAPGQADPTTSLPISFGVQFSEPVTGIDVARLSFAGSTANVSSARAAITGSGATYDVRISGVGPNGGTVRVSLLMGAAQDLVGNPSLASTSSDNSVIYLQGVMDGGFELTAGGLNPYWSSTSTRFGTSLCSLSVCGTGNGTAAPRNGNAWVWFDGTSGTSAEQGSASQAVIFPSGGVATLSYYLRIGFVNAPFTSTLQVKIDGTTVQTITEPSSAESGYTQRTVDVSAYADGATHSLRFEYSRPEGAASDNFTLDDVSLLTPTQTLRAHFDYDGDRKSDVSVFRPSTGLWYLLRSTAGYTGMQWGEGTDKITPADYDGDGKTDIAVFRASNSTWYIFNSATQTFSTENWGQTGDLAVPADYDGDGKADVSVYRPSDANWYRKLSGGGFSFVNFGTAEDKPVPADWDGDGRADIGVFRPSSGIWYFLRTTAGFTGIQWGVGTDIQAPGDYDGDGKTDVAVFRPENGTWYLGMSTSGFASVAWGQSGDIPSAGDFDGDGKADVAVFRPSNGHWYILNSTAGIADYHFGQSGDRPTQNAFIY
jgi:hypothetical protein